MNIAKKALIFLAIGTAAPAYSMEEEDLQTQLRVYKDLNKKMFSKFQEEQEKFTKEFEKMKIAFEEKSTLEKLLKKENEENELYKKEVLELKEKLKKSELEKKLLNSQLSSSEDDKRNLLTEVNEKKKLDKEQLALKKMLLKDTKEKEDLLRFQKEENEKLQKLLSEKQSIEDNLKNQLENVKQEGNNLKQESIKLQELLEEKTKKIEESRKKIKTYKSKIQTLTKSVENTMNSIKKSNPYYEIVNIIKNRNFNDGDAMALLTALRIKLGLNFEQIEREYSSKGDIEIVQIAYEMSKTADWEDIIYRKHEDLAAKKLRDQDIEKLKEKHFRSFDFLKAFYPPDCDPVMFGGIAMGNFKPEEIRFERNYKRTTENSVKIMGGTNSVDSTKYF